MSNSTTPMCGVIMGYYGPIWSQEELIDFASFCSTANLETFIYGPKMDNYLRADWQKDWPSEEFASLKKIRASFKKAGVKFGVAFSPINIEDLGSATKSALKTRIVGQINELELDILSIGFDDISGDIVSKLGTGLAPLQVEVAQYIKDQSNASSFYAVPSYYSSSPLLVSALGPRPKGYWEDFGKLDQSIGIFWTGSDVISKGYGIDPIKAIGKTFQRKVTLWDNYPVNDPEWMGISAANIYPFTGRPYQLADHIAGHFANPMIQPNLSKIPLSCLNNIYALKDDYIPQDQFIAAAGNICASPDLANYVIEEMMSFREISYRPDYKLAVTRLQNGLSGISGDQKIIDELSAWLTHVMNLRAFNKYSSYVPAGTYQITSKDISITVNALCEAVDGSWVQSLPLTYTPQDAQTCTDLSNNNGQLQLNT